MALSLFILCSLLTCNVLSSFNEKGWSMVDWTWNDNQFKDLSETWGAWIGCEASSDECPDNYPHVWYSATSGYPSSTCSTGRKKYCMYDPSPYSNIRWVGTAPSCSASCDDCKVLQNEHCLAKDNSGDGGSCLSGEKYMCVKYHSLDCNSGRRLIDEYTEYTSSEATPNGLETGFYLYFGDEFEDNLLLNDQELLNEFKSAVSKTLKELIADVNIEYDDVHISGSGYVNNKNMQIVGDKFKSIMKDAKLVPFINIKFDAHSTELLALKSYLLDDGNTETINKAIESNLNDASVFNDYHYELQVLFVDANCY